MPERPDSRTRAKQVCRACGATNSGGDFCRECGEFLWGDTRVPGPRTASDEPRPDPGPTGRSSPNRDAPAQPVPPEQPLPTLPEGMEPRHGDLVCGGCGAGNAPSRHFCRHCGRPLADTRVHRVPWHRRLRTRRQRHDPAGARPKNWRARRVERRRRRAGILAALALVAAGGYAVREPLSDGAVSAYDAVRDRFQSTSVGPASWRDARGVMAKPFEPNGWSAPRGPRPWLEAKFDSPTRLTRVFVQPGPPDTDRTKFEAVPRPSKIRIVALDGDRQRIGEPMTVDVADEPTPQPFGLVAEGTRFVRITVLSRQGPAQGTPTIAKVELQHREK